MVFSSFVFLFGFLPAALLFYYLAPRRWRNGVLLWLSLFFYFWGEPGYLWLMAAVIGMNFLLALPLEKYRKKWLLALGVGANLVCLGWFKYRPLLGLTGAALPMGISFYIFQAMSYLVDVYRGDAPAQKKITAFATYIALFPQLIAGPIIRFGELAPQLESRRENPGDFSSGSQLFLVGLSKKLLLANPMGLLWENLQGTPGTVAAWGGLVAFAFQIYYDFSGYSDMARGLGRMFGFRFPRNFNYPYTAQSVTDFWRRWHMSLSGRFREFVYIPLGGSRRGKGRQIGNIFLVWALTGLWHGASWNFLLWGLYYALLLTAEKLFALRWLERLPRLLRQGCTFFWVLLGWALFYFEDVGALTAFLPRLFSGAETPAAGWACLWSELIYLVSAAVCATPLLRRWLLRSRGRTLVRWGRVAAAGVLLLLCLGALARQGYNPFLYFRF